MNNCLNCGKETKNVKYCSMKCYMMNRWTTEARLIASNKFKKNNPSNKIEVKNKISNTLKRKYANGEIVSPLKNPEIHKKGMKTIKQMRKDGIFKQGVRPPAETIEKICGYCDKTFTIAHWQENKFCSRKCYKKFTAISENNPNYIENLDRIYPIEFNNNLKEQIRKRDNHTCQKCGKENSKEKLSIHHINYNKKNNNIENLISLCRKCHSITGGKRRLWEFYFNAVMKCKSIKIEYNYIENVWRCS